MVTSTESWVLSGRPIRLVGTQLADVLNLEHNLLLPYINLLIPL